MPILVMEYSIFRFLWYQFPLFTAPCHLSSRLTDGRTYGVRFVWYNEITLFQEALSMIPGLLHLGRPGKLVCGCDNVGDRCYHPENGIKTENKAKTLLSRPSFIYSHCGKIH